MLEAATAHMGARQQAYSDHGLFQHLEFTLHLSDTEFSFYSNVQVYNLLNCFTPDQANRERKRCCVSISILVFKITFNTNKLCRFSQTFNRQVTCLSYYIVFGLDAASIIVALYQYGFFPS